jgi:hypothetical protein
MLLVGALMKVDVFLLGRFALGELLLLALLPFALGSLGQLLSHRFFKWLIISIGLWMLGVVLSDVVNRNYLELFLRGFARPLVCLLILIPGHFLMKKNPRAIIWFFFGLCIAGIVNFLVPTDFRATDGGGGGISYKEFAFVWTPAAFGIVSVGGYFLYRFSAILSGLFQISCGIAAAPFFSRTTAAVFFVSGLIIVVSAILPRLRHMFILNGRIKRGSVAKFCLAGVIAFCLMYYLYAFTAKAGLLGDYQYLKFVNQSNMIFGNTPWGMLMAGRHYTLGAIFRIIENPIFGAGSWPYAGEAIAKAIETLGMPVDMNVADPFARDPGHSVFFGIWAQSGLLVLPCFFTLIAVIPRLFVHVIFVNTPLKALLLVYFISFTFSFFFNNFNSLMRVEMMFFPLLYYYNIQRNNVMMNTPAHR